MKAISLFVLWAGAAVSEPVFMEKFADQLVGLPLEAPARQALSQAHNAVQQSPSVAEKWGRLGQLLTVYDLVEFAREAYQVARRLAPDDPRWPFYLAVSYEGENVTRASALFAEAVAMGGPFQIDLARSLFLQGRLAEAIVLFRQLCADDAHHGCLGAAQVLFAQGDYGRARIFAALAMNLSEANSDLHVLLSQLHGLAGRWQQAEISAGRARALGHGRMPSNELRDALSALGGELGSQPVKATGGAGGKSAASLWFQDAELLMRSHRYAQACVSYQAAAERDPGSSKVRLALAYALIELGRGGEARRLAQSLLLKDRDNAQYQALLRATLD